MSKATRKPVSVDYFWLDKQNDMIPAMSYLINNGFQSELRVQLTNGVKTWTLEIDDVRPGAENNPATKRRTALLGDVLIWDGMNLSVRSKTDFDATHTIP